MTDTTKPASPLIMTTQLSGEELTRLIAEHTEHRLEQLVGAKKGHGPAFAVVVWGADGRPVWATNRGVPELQGALGLVLQHYVDQYNAGRPKILIPRH